MNGMRVHMAEDYADTMIVTTALNIAFQKDVEIKAEDTDILCLLVHHYRADHHHEMYLTTGKGTYPIKGI